MSSCIICNSLTAETLPGGKIRLEIQNEVAPANPNTRMRVADVVDLVHRRTGTKVTGNTIYRWVRDEGLPSHKVVGAIVFIEAEVDRWLISGGRKRATAL